MLDLLEASEAWFWWLGVLAAALAAGRLAAVLLGRLLARFAARTESHLDDAVVRRARGPVAVILPLLLFLIALRAQGLPAAVSRPVLHATGIGLILAAAWLAGALVEAMQDLARARFPLDVPDNREARAVRTRVQVVSRVLHAAIAVLAVAAVLMTFPSIRAIGASLLASAGILSLIVGLAARPALGNAIAGLQLALTTPVRLDDLVVVDGEQGRVEEIASTFVVVRLWDQRRLVLPLSYLLERPFENWSRGAPGLLGTALLEADYTLPVEEMRQELGRVLAASGMWDGKEMALHVTVARDGTIELRALFSVAGATARWELACHVREKLVDWLRRAHPECVPRRRSENWPVPVPVPARPPPGAV